MAKKVDQIELREKMANKAQPAARSQGNDVFTLIRRMEPAIKRALPRQISPERFSRIVMTAVRQTPKLQACSADSFLAAMMQSAQLGLEPNTPLGLAYIIPYGREAQFQIGYQGLLELAYRTGQYRSIYAQAVYENDEFTYEYGLDEKLVHVPADDPTGEPVRYYALYHLQNGGYGFVVMSRRQIELHRDTYAPAVKQGRHSPWLTDFDSMAKKTVLKQLLKYAPKSVEFASALAADETIKREIGDDMSAVETIDVTPVAETGEEEE